MYPYQNNQRNASPNGQPPQPGQFFPNQAPPPSSNHPIKPYGTGILAVLLGAYAAFWVFVFIGGAGAPNSIAVFVGNLGTSLFWGVLVSVLVVDWRGAISVNGWIQWQKLKRRNKILLGLLCFCVSPFLLGVYLVRVLLRNRQPVQPMLVAQGRPSSGRSKVGMAVGVGVMLIALLAYSVGNASGTGVGNAVVSSSANTSLAQTSNSTAVPTDPPTLLPTQPPTPTATQLPTPTATQPPAAPAPTQPPAHTGVNGNPWGYDFTPGNLIYNPPAAFCDYFNCISSFWTSTNGYVDECNDDTYSHSGGRSGACSHHGGEMRPLYSH
jgi:hypothetical protein